VKGVLVADWSSATPVRPGPRSWRSAVTEEGVRGACRLIGWRTRSRGLQMLTCGVAGAPAPGEGSGRWRPRSWAAERERSIG